MSKILSLSCLFFLLYFSSCNLQFSENKEKKDYNTLKTFDEIKDLPSILKKEKKAKEESDHLALAYAYRDKVTYYNHTNNRDSVLYYAQLGDQELNILKEKTPKLDKEQTKSYVTLKKNFASSIIDAYLSTNMYDLALIYLKKITEGEYLDSEDPSLDAQIHYLLGLTYIHSKKAEQALENFRKAYDLHQKAQNKGQYAYYLYFKGMIHAMMRLDNYDQMIVLSDSVNRMVDKEQQIIGEKDYLYYLIKYAIYYETGGAYIKKGNLKKARELLDEAKKVLANHIIDTPHKFIHYQIESIYYLTLGDYEKAKEYIDYYFEYEKALKGGDGIYNHLQTSLIKAEILRRSGEAEEAYDMLSRLYELNDSTNAANFSSQVAEIESIYQVDNMKLETERNKEAVRKMWLMVFSSFLISVLLAYIVYSYRLNSKRLKEKNILLFKKLSELEENNKRIKELQQKSYDEIKQTVKEKDSYDEIIDSLNSYMLETQAYRKPGISREELALAIGTNRQYLIEAIKGKTGKTYNEFIYSYRLKYAFDSIVKDKEKNITDIYLESGFLSNATFYRTFKEQYGMTPSELRSASQ